MRTHFVIFTCRHALDIEFLTPESKLSGISKFHTFPVSSFVHSVGQTASRAVSECVVCGQ